jgi:hypothetical protein
VEQVTLPDLPEPALEFCVLFSLGTIVVAVLAVSKALQTSRLRGRLQTLLNATAPATSRGPLSYRSGLLGSEALLFALFVLGFYFLEVFASYKAPYYLYPSILLPKLPAILPSWFIGRFPNFPGSPCATRVGDFLNSRDNRWHAIPFEVPLMEATLAYAMFRTTRLLGSPAWARPLLAAAALLALDAVLDPAVADVRDCENRPLAAGAGLWRWFLDESQMQSWQMIPLFNYAAWFGGALLAVSFGQLVTAVARKRAWKKGRRSEAGPHFWGFVLAAMGALAILVVRTTDTQLGKWVLVALTVTALAVAVGATYRSASTNHRPRLAFVAPVVFFLTIALLAYAWFGLGSTQSTRLLAAIVALAISLFLTLLPYWRRLIW